MKYYSNGGEQVFGISWWKDVAYDAQKPIIIEGQKREINGEVMWCAVNGDFCTPMEDCGNRCEDYAPCNRISGRCRELKSCFIGTGVKYKITPNGQVRKEP